MHAQRWAILAVLCVSVFLAVVDNTIVNVALPSISRQLHATISDLQWIVDAYSLVFASLLLVGGSLGDRYGRKGALQIGLVAFAGFSAFAGLSGSRHVPIVARCPMGLAAALIFPATLAILTNTFTDAKERAAAVGVWTGITGLGVALGPITGGLLLQHFSWGSVFFATIPIAVLARALGAWLVPTSRDPAAPRLDLAGLRPVDRRGGGGRLHDDRGAGAGLVGSGHPGRLRRRRRLAGGLRALGAPGRRADARHHLVAQHPLQRRQLLDRRRILRPVRLHLLDHPVLPDRPRLQSRFGRPATLPFALGVGAAATVAPVLARRLGTKIVVPAGLILMAAGFFIASTLGSDSAYVGPPTMREALASLQMIGLADAA